MRTMDAVERELDALPAGGPATEAATRLLALAEEALGIWVAARGEAPTDATREGFRLLALHRQGAQDVPSFNACRETCREVAWHYNLVTLEPDPALDAGRVRMMTMLVRHLVYFVGGKLQVEGLGDFCCASRPLRQEPAADPRG